MPLKPGSKNPQPNSLYSSSSPNPKKTSATITRNTRTLHHPSTIKKPLWSPAPSMSKYVSESNSRKRSGKSRDLDDEDAITILNAVVDFRAQHGGSAPTPTTMKPVFEAIKDSLHQDTTIDQLYNKFRSLKHRYYKAVNSGVGPTPFDRTFFDLSVRAWGEKKPKEIDEGGFEFRGEKKKSSKKPKEIDEGGFESRGEKKKSSKKPKEIDEGGFESRGEKKKSSKKPKLEEHGEAHNAVDSDDAANEEAMEVDAEEGEEEEDGDVGNSFKFLTYQARKYWEMERLSIPNLELGLKFMDKTKAATLEKRWRQHFEAGLKVEAKSLDLKKDLLTAITVGQKGASL